MKFQYIAEHRGMLTRNQLYRLMGVSERGLHASKHRPPSHRQRRDMVLLAHIRDQYGLSLVSYGRPRMIEKLNELGIRVGQRRVGRLMRPNGIQIIRSRKFKRTTNSDRAYDADGTGSTAAIQIAHFTAGTTLTVLVSAELV